MFALTVYWLKLFAHTVGGQAACVPVRRLWPPGWSDFVGVLVCGRARGLTGSQRPGLEKMGLGPGAPAVPAAGAGRRPQEGSAPAPCGCSLSVFSPRCRMPGPKVLEEEQSLVA